MESSRIDRLERLAELRASGALNDAEFEAEKAKLLNDRSRWPLYSGIGVLALGAATFAGVWTMRGAEPMPLPRATMTPKASATPLPLPSPSMAARSPQQFLNDAFFAATGHTRAYSKRSDGQETTTSPIRIIDLPFGRALLTKTETKDGCHACTGYIGVYYLGERNGAVTVKQSYPEAVSGWAWGNAPDFEVTTRFTANPAIYSSGGDMHQGYAGSGALITELRPTGPLASDLIDLGSDNTGAVGDEDMSQVCSLEGKITNIIPDKSFVVSMTGTTSQRVRYGKRDGRFVALDKGAKSCI